jgi:hypothetical protein
MALLEDRTAAFIVRIWCERGEEDAANAEWRGSVEHVQSGERTFFRHLETVVEFMKPRLVGIGIDAQQRFWERISSVINDVGGAPVELALDLPAPLAMQARPGQTLSERKRR